MKIATWNILHGMAVPEGIVHNDRLIERAAQLEVDLLALQEVDFFQERSQFTDQSALVAQALNAQHLSRGITLVGTPGEKWREFSADTGADNDSSFKDSDELIGDKAHYGNAIISRIPIVKRFRLNLGRSPIGAPLAIPKAPPSERGPQIRLIYIHDEPRVAHAVHLENGVTVINTHLSFVPGVNAFQLRKIRRWAQSLPGEKIILGDFNLPGKLPEKITGWRSSTRDFTYPSWGAKLQFDHILVEESSSLQVRELKFSPPTHMVSDHLPLGIECEGL